MTHRTAGLESDNVLDDAFISVSTEGTTLVVPLSRTSQVTDSSLPPADSLSQGRRTNSLSMPLARAVSRRERPLTSMLWEDEYLSQVSQSPPVDIPFESRIIRGVSLEIPQVPRWVLDGPREKGTLSSRRHARPLPSSVQCVRLRRDCLLRSVSRSPVLTFTRVEVGAGEHSILVYHNAIRAEIHSLYLILSSLEARQLDVNAEDFRAFYAWLSTFGDFLRLYLSATERFLFHIIDEVTDMELREELDPSKRKRTKLKIVGSLELVEAMKRKSEAQPERAQECVQELIGASDRFSMKLLNYLNAEAEQVPSILLTNFHREHVISIYGQFVEYFLATASGPLLLVTLSRGSAEEATLQRRWLKQAIQANQKSRLRSSITSARWVRRYQEVQMQYVSGFVRACQEYRAFYS